jgi:uncharacterized protein YbjT (DUF2867 family)
MAKTALIAGATGLVGGHLLDLLMEDKAYSTVKVLTRRSLGGSQGKMKEIIMPDFEAIDEHVKKLSADDYFCCLGTTMKKAGSKEAFKKVDFEYPLSLAAVARENNADGFYLVSALGADKKSLFFYNRVKGETEYGIKAFKLNRFYIFQPSLLLGERNENRTGEDVGKWVAKNMGFVFSGPLKKYSGIEGKTVAQAMLKAAHEEKSPFRTFRSDEMKEYI